MKPPSKGRLLYWGAVDMNVLLMGNITVQIEPCRPSKGFSFRPLMEHLFLEMFKPVVRYILGPMAVVWLDLEAEQEAQTLETRSGTLTKAAALKWGLRSPGRAVPIFLLHI
jgi:hypothetical protein